MRYHNITKDDMLNGDGLRVVLWVAGCNHYCVGCQNQMTWDPNDGLEFDDAALAEIFDQLSQDYISGLTLSGGDPLYPNNRYKVEQICHLAKDRFPSKNIWLYTGYFFEQVQDLPVIQYIDVLVDGPFMQELADVKCKWAGSVNQRIWRKIDGEWRVDTDERNRLETRSAEACSGCR